jgi:hypothetical protein
VRVLGDAHVNCKGDLECDSTLKLISPIAALKGGTFPQAYVYPAPVRATRDLMRRRNYLMRKRAELLVHIQNTNSQYNLPGHSLHNQNRKLSQDTSTPSIQSARAFDPRCAALRLLTAGAS